MPVIRNFAKRDELWGIILLVVLAFFAFPQASAEALSCDSTVLDEPDGQGLIAGSSCSEVIVATTDTTAIRAGGGDDLIVASPSVDLIEAGDGWDLVFGNNSGATVMGGAGDDVISGEVPSSFRSLSASVKWQISNAADGLVGRSSAAYIRNARMAVTYRSKPIAQSISEYRGRSSIGADRVRVLGGGGRKLVGAKLLHKLSRLRSTAARASSRVARLIQASRGDMNIASEPLGDDFDGTGAAEYFFGGRGNDTLDGNGGQDVLYGGVGDDHVFGDGDNDLLFGGMGTDRMDGGPGDDQVQGDASFDKMIDSGGGSNDTLNFSSAGTPGFSGDMSAFPNFPPEGGERGIYVNLSAGFADNGDVLDGGGFDKKQTYKTSGAIEDEGTEYSNFEHVIGSPFSDYIVGSAAINILDGGGGSDVIVGNGNTDSLVGEAGGDNLRADFGSLIIGGIGEDYCQNPGGPWPLIQCEAKPSNWVSQRATGSIAVGMTSQGGTYFGQGNAQLYLVGSSATGGETGLDSVRVIEQFPSALGSSIQVHKRVYSKLGAVLH